MLDIVSQPSFLHKVSTIGELFELNLKHFKNTGIIKEIRGRGLMWGLEFPDEMTSMAFTVMMIKNGIFADFCGNFKETIKLMPPLIIEEKDVKEIMSRLEKAFLALQQLK